MAGQVKPLARSRDLIIEEVEGEVLIYDENSETAHSLAPEAAQVWRACDGQTPIDVLTDDTGLDADTVNRALAELQSRGLLADGHSGNVLTRRDLSINVAKVGAAVAAAPLIVSIKPAVAEAQTTPTPEVCAQYNAESCSSCDEVIGCCCCCQEGFGESACKLCFPESTCSAFDCSFTGVDCVDDPKDPDCGNCTGGGQPTCAPGTTFVNMQGMTVACTCENLDPNAKGCGCCYGPSPPCP
jgi:hypothetical protein